MGKAQPAAPVTLDEQIEYQRLVVDLETARGHDTENEQAILTSLRELKRLREMKGLPEPVARIINDDIEQLVRMPDGPLYGPEVIELLAAEREENTRLRENVGCARRQRSTQFCAEAVDAKSKLAKVMQGLREPTEKMLEAGYSLQHEPAHGVDDIWNAMSAELIRSVEKDANDPI